MKRSIGILSKIRYYVNINILVKLYYALIYPFLTYGILAWGNTYPTTLQPICTIQKKALRIMTFSKQDANSSPLFKYLKIVKYSDLFYLNIIIFMHKFHNHLLQPVFNNFFTLINKTHNYNTRLASKQSYSLPKARTNYAIFNIRFQGVKLWNSLDESLKFLSTSQLNSKLKISFLDLFCKA